MVEGGSEFVIRSSVGLLITAGGSRICDTTISMVKFRAAWEGLKYATQKGNSHLMLMGDSTIVLVGF